ncbi:hypothetical protein T07_2170 [Trichinella nelsoni]|uniref:Uncharacterized protein n=1 Tax=Trichinella nelsoni TaxID=6336 RepID=A0A0V0SIV4_9BILA|nr:hypothetical protein T07_2170 [Trichinella nelsoni]
MMVQFTVFTADARNDFDTLVNAAPINVTGRKHEMSFIGFHNWLTQTLKLKISKFKDEIVLFVDTLCKIKTKSKILNDAVVIG